MQQALIAVAVFDDLLNVVVGVGLQRFTGLGLERFALCRLGALVKQADGLICSLYHLLWAVYPIVSQHLSPPRKTESKRHPTCRSLKVN